LPAKHHQYLLFLAFLLAWLLFFFQLDFFNFAKGSKQGWRSMLCMIAYHHNHHHHHHHHIVIHTQAITTTAAIICTLSQNEQNTILLTHITSKYHDGEIVIKSRATTSAPVPPHILVFYTLFWWHTKKAKLTNLSFLYIISFQKKLYLCITSTDPLLLTTHIYYTLQFCITRTTFFSPFRKMLVIQMRVFIIIMIIERNNILLWLCSGCWQYDLMIIIIFFLNSCSFTSLGRQDNFFRSRLLCWISLLHTCVIMYIGEYVCVRYYFFNCSSSFRY